MPSPRKWSSKSQEADVGRFALLLSIVIVIILLLGLVGLPDSSDGESRLIQIVLTILASGVLVTALRVARVSRQHRRWFGTLVAVLLLMSIAGVLFSSNAVVGQIVSFLWVMLVLSAPVLVLRQVLSADRVNAQTILGAITVYLLIGVSLTLLSIAMQGSVGFFAEAPRSTAYVYFAFVTITSLGYGDLSPYTDGARMVSIAGAVIAQMYLVIVVARLVSIWRSQPDPDGVQ